MVVIIGSWSAKGGRSVAASEEAPRASIGPLAHTKSIIFRSRVRESGGRVRVRLWESAHLKKGSAWGEGWTSCCHAGCRRLKSPEIRHGLVPHRVILRGRCTR